MYDIKPSTQFKKDIKRIKKSGRGKKDLEEMKKIIDELAIPAILPKKNKDHSLSGNYYSYKECHIFPDLLLIYNQNKEKKYCLFTELGHIRNCLGRISV